MTMFILKKTTILRAIILLLLVIFCGGFFSVSIATPLPPVLTLDDAVMLALRYNPDVRNAKLQRIVDKFNLRVAQWAYEVQYSIIGNYNYNDPVVAGRGDPSDLTTVAPTASILTPIGTAVSVSANNAFNHTFGQPNYYSPTVTFSVKQPLLKGFGRDVTLEPLHLAQNAALNARLTYRGQIMSTLTNVVSQYAAVVNAQNALKTNQLSLQTSAATLQQQTELVKAGRAAPADLIQFQATVASGKLAVEQSQVALLQTKQSLLVLLGIDPSIPITVSDTIVYPCENVPALADSIRMALSYNTDYLKQMIVLKDDELQLLMAKDATRWELDATAQRIQGQGIAGSPNSTNPSSLLNNFNVVDAYGLSLTVPINNLAQKNAFLSAKIALQQEQISLMAAKQTVISTITSDYYTVINQKQQIDQALQSVDLAKKNLAIEQAKYKYGRSSAFELTSLQSAVTTAQLAYTAALTSYVTSLAAYDQALGIALNRWNIQLCY